MASNPIVSNLLLVCLGWLGCRAGSMDALGLAEPYRLHGAAQSGGASVWGRARSTGQPAGHTRSGTSPPVGAVPWVAPLWGASSQLAPACAASGAAERYGLGEVGAALHAGQRSRLDGSRVESERSAAVPRAAGAAAPSAGRACGAGSGQAQCAYRQGRRAQQGPENPMRRLRTGWCTRYRRLGSGLPYLSVRHWYTTHSSMYLHIFR